MLIALAVHGKLKSEEFVSPEDLNIACKSGCVHEVLDEEAEPENDHGWETDIQPVYIPPTELHLTYLMTLILSVVIFF